MTEKRVTIFMKFEKSAIENLKIPNLREKKNKLFPKHPQPVQNKFMISEK